MGRLLELLAECSPPNNPCANRLMPRALTLTRGPTSTVVVRGTGSLPQDRSARRRLRPPGTDAGECAGRLPIHSGRPYWDRRRRSRCGCIRRRRRDCAGTAADDGTADESTQEITKIIRKERIRMDVSAAAAALCIGKDGTGNTAVASVWSGRAARGVNKSAASRVESGAREKSG